MRSRPLVLVGVVLGVALGAVVVLGLRVFQRDRDAMLARFGHEREVGLAEAARGLVSDLADVGDDLVLASAVLHSADSTTLAERELHAIATIKREYLAMHARTDDGVTTKVVALDAPPGTAELADRALDDALDAAERDHWAIYIAAAPRNGAPSWLRVFARRPEAHGPAVAVLVDMEVVLARLKVQRDPMSRIAVFDAHGTAAALSDRTLAALVRERPDLVRGAQIVVDGATAHRIGLPESRAIAIGVPIVVDVEAPWTLLSIVSTQSLQRQEQTIVRRVLVGGALVLVLLVSAAAYVLYNTFRSRALRERLNHTERLAHLTEKAEKILDHIPSGVLALTEDKRVSGVNRWLAQRLGRDVVGQSLAETFASARPIDVEQITRLLDAALETRDPQRLRDESSSLLGAEAALELRTVPLARGSGDVSVLLVIEDLTELRRIEQRLLHSEKLVTAGQLAAGIAHEVGTPLNVARGRVELSLSHLGEQHAEADNQRIVLDQIDRVTRLIQQLLDYVRPTPALVQPVDLAASLRVVKDLLEPQATKRKVALDVEASEPMARLLADADQVQQIVVNLALNAVDACEKGGRVVLRVGAREGGVMLEVADTGQGIPPEIRTQVFDPFFTTKKRGQGTGLGLWVVAQLVRAQAAEIEIDSTPGKGTTVRVVWPHA